jgi:hypothetical protein
MRQCETNEKNGDSNGAQTHFNLQVNNMLVCVRVSPDCRKCLGNVVMNIRRVKPLEEF